MRREITIAGLLRCCRTFLIIVTLLSVVQDLRGQPKPVSQVTVPKILVAAPMGVTAGGTAKVLLHGLRLGNVADVHCQSPAGKVKLLNKGKASGPVRANDVPRIGDTQVEIEVTLPADYPGPMFMVTVSNAAGESNTKGLFVDRGSVIAEKEPNNGFAKAQAISVGQTVAGFVDRGLDVDVFCFEGKAGQRVIAEVIAARFGSGLDSLLTLYSGDGQTLAVNDDLDETTTDSRLEVTLPRNGTYYLVLMDANDQGGSAHVYRLSLRDSKDTKP